MNILAKFALLMSGAAAVCGAAAAQEDLLMQDTIVIEGSRMNSMLANIEPEVSLDFAEIRSYGAESLEDLLADLAPLTESSRGNGAPAVLLNGRRISGFREIRNYPPEALARVEILPEEVALKFGFRADQKVINFVLRERFHALTGRSELGAPTDGGQWLGELDASNLRIRDDVRWNVDLDYEYQDALYESDRDIVNEDPALTADRTLQPEKQEIELTGSYSHFLPADINATYALGVDASKQKTAIVQSDLTETLDRDTDAWGADASFVLGKVYDDWNWSLNGGLSYSNTETKTALDTITGFGERTEATSDEANLEGVAFFKLAELPAGDLATTLKAGLGAYDLTTVSNSFGLVEKVELSRDQANAQINLDAPLIDSDMAGQPFGSLSLSANARVDDLSDAGALSTYGWGLSWRPTDTLQIIASSSLTEDAPTLEELGAPVSTNENARIFDFSTGQTIENVTRLSGGNLGLIPEERTVRALGLSWEPFEAHDVTFKFDYTDTDIENAILAFPGVTPQIEAAFPERVLRDVDETLTQVDARPINIAETTNRQLRYGLNSSIELPAPERVDLEDDERRQLREMFLRRLDKEDRARVEQRIAEREAQRATGGQREPGGGGLRASGGPRQGGGPGGRRGPRGAGRLFVSVYHTVVLEDSLQIAAGGDRLDLLNGDAISEDGGVSEHRVTAQAGFSRGALGAFVRTSWQSETEFDDGVGGALYFDDLITTNLRVQYDFGRNPKLLLKYPFLDSTRVSLNVQNLFDEKQNVTDASGAVPITYQPDLLDPRGRTVTLKLRKLFY